MLVGPEEFKVIDLGIVLRFSECVRLRNCDVSNSECKNYLLI